ncbi:MAG TPA: cytochrome P450 [Actinomycetospora sp.]|uniref:cytochrome P450 n=1 Tax=Actinomycetospora sp. TaxID=1872135 RepID=UPI002F3F301B
MSVHTEPDVAPVPPLGLRRDGLDPDPRVTALREHDGTCPVTTLAGHRAELVAGFHDARTVHGDPAFRFETVPPPPGITDELTAAEMHRRRSGMLLAIDPPDHTRLRRMLTGRFTVRAMKALEPRVAAIVADALTAMADGGPPADLVADFALPVPSLVICELLGVPYADRGGFQERAERTLRSDLTPAKRSQVIRASREYMATLVERARRDPGDDLIGMLVREHGDRPAAEGGIDGEELAGLANLLLIAGHETTSNVIALGALELLTDPDQMALLRAAVSDPDPAPLTRAVEELLRHVSPVSAGFPRVASRDVVVGTHEIRAGTMVTASLCAANRDSALASGDLDHLDLSREPLPHVAFGYGIHHCLGAPLARIELRIAFSALLDRFPGLALAVDPAELEFRRDALIHGVEALPVTW